MAFVKISIFIVLISFTVFETVHAAAIEKQNTVQQYYNADKVSKKNIYTSFHNFTSKLFESLYVLLIFTDYLFHYTHCCYRLLGDGFSLAQLAITDLPTFQNV